MSSLLDKILTLINARARGPQQTRPPQPPPAGQPPAPPPAGKVPEVTEGRPHKSEVEVSEMASKPSARPRETPPPPPPPPGELDEGRVADMLKKNRKK